MVRIMNIIRITRPVSVQTENLTVYTLVPLLLLSLFSICTLTSISSGATYYIDPVTGNDANPGTSSQPWKTIERAMSDNPNDPNVNNGDTVYLRSGNYGQAIFDHPVTDRTSWSDGIIYKSAPGAQPDFSKLYVTGGCDRYLTFDGLTVRVTSGNTNVSSIDCSYVKLQNCTFEGNYGADNQVDLSGVGVAIGEDFDVGNVLVDNCEIYHCHRAIIVYSDITEPNIVIRNNTIHHLRGSAILLEYASNPEGNIILIEGNTIYAQEPGPKGYHGSGIALFTDHVTIRNNVFHDYGNTSVIQAYNNGIYPGKGGYNYVTIENNIFYDAKYVDSAYTGTGWRIVNNTFIGVWSGESTVNSWHGTTCTFGMDSNYPADANFVFSNNICVGIVSFDADLNSLPNLTETNNIVWSYLNGSDSWAESMPGSGSYLICRGRGNCDDVDYFKLSNKFFIGGVNFDTYAWTVDHGQDLTGAFQLAPGSKAVGFADRTHATSSDILGVSRDSSPDAGCYEYVSQNPDNQPPVLRPIGNKSVDENTLLSFTITADDPEGDNVAYSIQNKPTGASFTDQTFRWTPTYDQAGTYLVTFIATDLDGAQDSETISITVNDVNRPPEADSIGDQSGSENQTLSFSISASDPDGDDLIYTVDPLPPGAVLAGQTFIWTPGYDQAGTYPVTCTVSDGQNQVSEAIVITISNVNRSPVLDPVTDQTVYSGSLLRLTVSATDPDGDTVQYSANGLPDDAVFSDQTLEWTPSNSQNGDYTVTFVASDGQLQDLQTVTITVSTDNSAPRVTSCSPADGAVQVPLNNLVTLHIVDADAGVDANSVRIKVDDTLVYSGNTTEYNSIYGRCYRTGTPADFKFVYQAAQMFDFDRTLEIKVNAADLCGNMMSEYAFSFETEMLSFGENHPVNSDSLAKGGPATVRDSSGNIWTAWHAGPAGARDVYIAKLAVGASGFGSTTRLTNNAMDQCNPALTIGPDDKLYVVWQDNRNGNWDIYARTSLDGEVWSAEARVTDSQENEINPAVALNHASTPVAYVAWQDDRFGNQDIYIAASSNGFVTSAVSQVTSNPLDQREPTVAADSSNTVYVFWTDNRGGSDDIYAAASDSGPWTNVPVVVKAAAQSSPAVAVEQSGSVLHILWVDESSGNKDIYYATSTALPPSPLNGTNIIDDTTGADQSEPAVVVTGSAGNNLRVFACWKDERNAPTSQDTDIYMVEIGTEENVFVGDDQTDSDQSDPAIGIDSYGYPYLVWSDNRDTNQNVYYAGSTFAQPTALAAQDISATSGGTVGTDPAAISSTDDVSVIISPEASSINTTITISKVVNPPKVGLERFSLPYEFGPSGIQFSQPVTITIPYTVADDGLNVSAYWYDPLTGTLSQQGITDVRTIAVSPNLHALQFKTTHFTQFFVGSGSTTGGGGGGGGGCAMSTCEQAGILEFMLPYIALAGIMMLLKLRDAQARSLKQRHKERAAG